MKFFLSLFCIVGTLITACSKSDSGQKSNNGPTAVKITILSIDTGIYGATVKIIGSGFSATAANDQVFFNGTAATITAANSQELTTLVPLRAGTGKVTVSVNGGTAVVGPVFKYIPSPVVSTFAGSGAQGNTDGAGTAASFYNPCSMVVDAAGNLYVSDRGNNLIRKITPAGIVSTFAGSGAQGSTDGPALSASFYGQDGLAMDAAGNMYVADALNNLIRKITPAGVVSTFAGSGAQGRADGTGTAASFFTPSGIALDAAGNLYVTDLQNNLIRKITPTGVVSTFAGSGAQGSANGTGTAAVLDWPFCIVIDGAGNLYEGEGEDNLIRKITPAAAVTVFAGTGLDGDVDGTGTGASFNAPLALAIDAAGNIYVADTFNFVIRSISPSAVVRTFAGSYKQGKSDGQGMMATFGGAQGVAVDAAGDVYVADSGNNLIRKIVIE